MKIIPEKKVEFGVREGRVKFNVLYRTYRWERLKRFSGWYSFPGFYDGDEWFKPHGTIEWCEEFLDQFETWEDVETFVEERSYIPKPSCKYKVIDR